MIQKIETHKATNEKHWSEFPSGTLLEADGYVYLVIDASAKSGGATRLLDMTWAPPFLCNGVLEADKSRKYTPISGKITLEF